MDKEFKFGIKAIIELIIGIYLLALFIPVALVIAYSIINGVGIEQIVSDNTFAFIVLIVHFVSVVAAIRVFIFSTRVILKGNTFVFKNIFVSKKIDIAEIRRIRKSHYLCLLLI